MSELGSHDSPILPGIWIFPPLVTVTGAPPASAPPPAFFTIGGIITFLTLGGIVAPAAVVTAPPAEVTTGTFNKNEYL